MRIKMKKVDQITAIVLFLFSAFVIEESLKMSLFAEFAPDYGFFPFWLGVLMAILSIMLFVDAWRRAVALDTDAPFPGRQAFINVLIILSSLGVYAFLMEIAGYILDTLLLVVLLLGVVERERWQTTLFAAVLITAGLYLIFQVALGISLPKGVFGF